MDQKTFDEHVHSHVGRRMFLDRAVRCAVGGVAAAAFVDALNPTFAAAQQVPPFDKRLLAEYVHFSSPEGSGKVRGYLARPWRMSMQTVRAPAGLTGRRRPGVLVVHDNRGLTPHMEDIARRVTIENFVAFAPDALTPPGGSSGNESQARELPGRIDQAKTHEDFVAGANHLKTLNECTGRIAVVGFSDGGSIAALLATRLPDLRAAVAFYGSPPPAEEVARIKVPLLLHYAEDDEGINAGWPAFEAALKASGVRYTMYRYPGTQHGFHDDTSSRYNEAAATLAWTRTIDFLRRALRG